MPEPNIHEQTYQELQIQTAILEEIRDTNHQAEANGQIVFLLVVVAASSSITTGLISTLIVLRALRGREVV